MTLIPIFLVLVVAISFPGITAFIRWSERRRILDIPNERSSHRTPVPVGAGLVLSTGVLLPYVLFLFVNGFVCDRCAAVSPAAMFAIPLSLAGVAIIGWIDDLKGLPILPRLIVHVIAAGLVCGVFLWQQPAFSQSGLFFAGICLVTAVGLTNAYNFMDGIDGIAGLQGIVSGLFWGSVGLIVGAEAVAFLGFAIALGTASFLFFNWSPAKVFLGDSGSGFLGLSFALFPVLAVSEINGMTAAQATNPTYFVFAAIITVWPFVFDSAFTFFKRLFGGERVWEPHRAHIYQQLVILGDTHREVATIYGISAAICSFTAILWLIGWIGIVIPVSAMILVSVAILFFLRLAAK